MRNPVAKAWLCVGVILSGIPLMMVSMSFLDNDVLFKVFMILGIAVFIGGVILHYAIVRCPHCGTHLGKIYGPRCPFCGKEYNKTE